MKCMVNRVGQSRTWKSNLLMTCELRLDIMWPRFMRIKLSNNSHILVLRLMNSAHDITFSTKCEILESFQHCQSIAGLHPGREVLGSSTTPLQYTIFCVSTTDSFVTDSFVTSVTNQHTATMKDIHQTHHFKHVYVSS